MNRPTAISSHEWLSPEAPLCTLAISAAEMAAKVGIALNAWEEDGLGTFTGFACRLPSGLFALVQESAYRLTSLGAQRATVLVEADVLAARGASELVTEVVSCFGLQAEHVSWVTESKP